MAPDLTSLDSVLHQIFGANNASSLNHAIKVSGRQWGGEEGEGEAAHEERMSWEGWLWCRGEMSRWACSDRDPSSSALSTRQE